MTETTQKEIEITREFDAPCELVFANWTEAEHLGAWFAPAGFDVLECSVDLRPGGLWRVAYRSAQGEQFTEHGQFIEVARPDSLHLTLINENERGEMMLRTEVKVTFRGRTARR